MHKQRIALIIAGGLGMLATFLPWRSAMGFSANGTHEEFGLYELTDWEIFYQLQMIGAGWFTLCIFAISIAIAFSGKIAEPLGKIKFLSISIGIINAIIGILLIIAIENKFAPFTFLSNGLYLLIFAGIAVSVIPFISALAKK